MPPSLGARYQVYVPKPDADGLDVAGIRPIEVARADGDAHRMECACRRAAGGRSLRAERIVRALREDEGRRGRLRDDPRPSFEERYGDRAGFVKAVEVAARALVSERFLLQEDADRYIEAARAGGELP